MPVKRVIQQRSRLQAIYRNLRSWRWIPKHVRGIRAFRECVVERTCDRKAWHYLRHDNVYSSVVWCRVVNMHVFEIIRVAFTLIKQTYSSRLPFDCALIIPLSLILPCCVFVRMHTSEKQCKRPGCWIFRRWGGTMHYWLIFLATLRVDLSQSSIRDSFISVSGWAFYKYLVIPI